MKAAHVTIENLTRRHLPDAVEVIAQAFYKNPMALHAFPDCDDDSRLRRVRRIYRGVMEMALQRGRVFVVRQSGRICGAAVAYPPNSGVQNLASRLLSGAGAFTVGPRATMRYVTYEREVRKMRPKEPHWYLFFLGVTPAFHGQGIGNAFVKHVCRMADSEGVACYLETSVEAQIDFYGEHDFELTESKTLDSLGGMVVSGMLRKAKR